MSKFTLYTKEHCVQCNATVRKMKELGISAETLDATEHIEALKEMGHTQAPVVIAPDGTHWSGYNPDMLAKHSQMLLV